jgi:hypothetical protein
LRLQLYHSSAPCHHRRDLSGISSSPGDFSCLYAKFILKGFVPLDSEGLNFKKKGAFGARQDVASLKRTRTSEAEAELCQ